MFENEAKEYLKKDGTKAEQILDMLNEISPLEITLKQAPFILAMIQQVFKDGAEFGYNKSKEELNQNGLALQSDMDKTIKQNIALKKENAELKTKKIPQLERKISSIRGCHSVAVKKLNARIEQVERLKKENAELRQKLRSKL